MLQAWDFRPGEDFVERMDRAMRESERTIAVLSRDYFRSSYAVPEWTHAISQDPTGRLGVLVPVRVDDVVVEGIFRTRTWIDLVGKPAEAAHSALSTAYGASAYGRLRPRDTPKACGRGSPVRCHRSGACRMTGTPSFTGRDQFLGDLRAALVEGDRRPEVAALVGIGGVGKTALAVELAYRASAAYGVVWWARAERREVLVADLAELAGPLGISRAEGDSMRDVALVRDWLEQHDEWLLVLDDAPGPEPLRGLVPQGGGGHVLVTSRSPAWRREASIVRTIPPLDPVDGAELLRRRSGEDPDDHARTLVTMLGSLPLALELVGAFLERQGLSYADYEARLRRHGGLPAEGRDRGAPGLREHARERMGRVNAHR